MTTYAQKYPIGQFVKPAEITQPLLTEWISTISALPQDLQKEIEILSDQQLDTPYRDGGWTVRQVVHHYADSHMNAFCRFKLALTEDNPVIKPYFEERWAEHPDGKAISVDSSLAILQGLHHRWMILLQGLREQDLPRTFVHPEHGREISLEEAIGMYAWHCRHHLAHIRLVTKTNEKK